MPDSKLSENDVHVFQFSKKFKMKKKKLDRMLQIIELFRTGLQYFLSTLGFSTIAEVNKVKRRDIILLS